MTSPEGERDKRGPGHRNNYVTDVITICFKTLALAFAKNRASAST